MKKRKQKKLYKGARPKGDKIVKQQKILISDDERDLVLMLKLRFEIEGFKVIEAYDGEETLSQVHKEKPDLILLDGMMPKINGFEVCRQIKEKNKQIPIIMFTAKGQEEDKEMGKRVGADDYVIKPFEFNDLIMLIKKHLNVL